MLAAREHIVRTAGGRTLSVLEAGRPDGHPVVLHNGTPGARLMYRVWIEAAAAAGIRLVAYDRPGYGRSTPQAGRTVADAARDVESIADALGLGRFAVLGMSGGGPHALACAALLADRVTAAATLASFAPRTARGLDWLDGMGNDNVREWSLAEAGRVPLAASIARWAADLLAAESVTLADELESLLSPVDRAAVSGDYAEYLVAMTHVGLGHGIDGWLDDDRALVSPWGFNVEDVRTPVLVWHGKQDRFVPVTHGQWLSTHIPRAEPRLSEHDGHLTLFVHRFPEAFAWLLDRT